MEDIDNNQDIVKIPAEDSDAEKIRKKRNLMCNEILKLEQDNIYRTSKLSEVEMAKKIVDIIRRQA